MAEVLADAQARLRRLSPREAQAAVSAAGRSSTRGPRRRSRKKARYPTRSRSPRTATSHGSPRIGRSTRCRRDRAGAALPQDLRSERLLELAQRVAVRLFVERSDAA